ncbi:hypothetical protein BD309DRAFT_877769 [Dichomitus squalens]|nr:hypothetical protein BD309DRAFT_877769 [Dichomitus squalens]
MGRKRSWQDHSTCSTGTESKHDNPNAHSGSKGGRGTSPDVAIYRDNQRSRDLLVIDPETYESRTRSKKPADVEWRKKWAGHRSWSDIIVLFEAKANHSLSAFEFLNSKSSFLRSGADGGMEGIGQFLEYISQVFSHQHRTHVISVYVYLNQARIAYCDRSGAVVSEPFDYGTRKNGLLHRFFWKIARMSSEELGIDGSLTLASLADISALRVYASNLPPGYLREQACRALSWNPNGKSELPPHPHHPIYQLSLGVRTVFIGRPSSAPLSLFGRCTRGYPAFEREKSQGSNEIRWRMRFLKDSWRVQDTEGRIHPEYAVYDRLHNRGVTDHVLSCLAGGDVPTQEGSLQRTTLQSEGYHPRAHSRILLSHLCRPLSDFKDFRELSGLLRDALNAHKDAWEKAEVLHRDVSFSNILILETVSDSGEVIKRQGVLSDWDLSKYREDMARDARPRQPDMTGTWIFRSAVSGRYPRKPYEVSDDVESFVHVFHYSVLRFHQTDLTSGLANAFSLHFSAYERRSTDGAHMGSSTKWYHCRANGQFFAPAGNDALSKMLRSIGALCYQHYSLIDVDLYARMYGDPQGIPAPVASQSLDNGPTLQGALSNHKGLLEIFGANALGSSDCGQRSAIDLFKQAGLLPAVSNQTSSMMSRQDQRPEDAVHVSKKLRGNDGAILQSVDEGQEPFKPMD